MMQATPLTSESHKPYLSEEVMLGIDSVHLAVTLKGEQHTFDDKYEMERFLRALWEQEVSV
ncbi:hypothetical protein [Motiliproteus sediminis]|uniref:hypothetical protein n=1 Tax=Motiliproteus sediminis TaxID=1468178 RepID=UPI001AEFC0C3|nr:hypothetical protein [Motiliproteus sediminis]